MTKDEAERARAQVSASSLPPGPPRPAQTVAPSIPPQTDDIDTDWGVESEAVPPVAETAAQPAAPAPAVAPVAASAPAPVIAPVVAPEAPPRAPSVPPRASSIPPRAPAVIPSARSSAPPPAPVAEERAPRHIPIRSQTLIGIANPPPPPTPPAPVDFTPLPAASVPSLATLRADVEATRPVAPSVAPAAPVASTPPAAPREPVVTPTTAPHELEAAVRPQPISPTASDAEPPHSMRVYAWLAAAAVVVGALAYVRLHRSSSAPSAQAVVTAPTQAPASPAASAIAEPIAATPSATAAAPSSAPSTASTDTPAADNTASAPSSEAPATSGDAPVDSAGMITVTVNSKPPNAQFFHFGKQVGTAPFVVQLKPGEHHAYEVGLPGHITRKLVLDGSKTELTVGLREQPR